jgi:hypothetical protein
VRRRKRREDSLAVFLRDSKEKWKGGSWWGRRDGISSRALKRGFSQDRSRMKPHDSSGIRWGDREQRKVPRKGKELEDKEDIRQMKLAIVGRERKRMG